MGVIPNPKMAFIFPISCILVLISPFFMIYFPKCEGKGSSPKSQIKSLTYVLGTQKKPLNETVLLEHPKHMLKLMGKKIFKILRSKIVFI